MNSKSNTSDSMFPKYDKEKMVVIIKDDLKEKDCECLCKDINKAVRELVEKGEISEDEFAEFEREPNFNIENVELWKNIKSEIVGRVIRSHNGQNRNSAEFIHNFKHTFPEEKIPSNITYEKMAAPQENGENAVVIAVLDTGVDLGVIPDEYLWKGTIGDQEKGNYQEFNGKNFLVEDLNLDGENYDKYETHDDHQGSHGTLINAFIIEQFKAAGKSVKIMNLKTLNSHGIGNLFSTVAAIRFAMNNGAHIINASWGFYSDEEDEVFLPIKDLITKSLAKKNILFVTAAGNAFPEDDAAFLSKNQSEKGSNKDVRNLSDNHFFPAYFGKEIQDDLKNIFVVTTLSEEDGKYEVSSNQNYSDKIVDFGVVADKVIGKEKNEFKIPLQVSDSTSSTPSYSVFGSSFAAAIVTGKIGANFLSDFISPLGKNKITSNHMPHPSFIKEDLGILDKIIKGAYMEK